MKLPDSPQDRRARDEALARVAKRVAVAGVPTLIIGALTYALGVPWWIVLAAGLVVVLVVLFEA